MQLACYRIWTRVAVSISYDDNHYTTGTSSTYGEAYRPSGNRIVERNHLIIKAIAERGGISPAEAVFWYNMSPKSGQLDKTVPQRAVFNYHWRYSKVKPVTKQANLPESILVGEEFWVKPPGVCCMSKWKRGRINRVLLQNNVEVDGLPRHILDLRLFHGPSANDRDIETQS